MNSFPSTTRVVLHETILIIKITSVYHTLESGWISRFRCPLGFKPIKLNKPSTTPEEIEMSLKERVLEIEDMKEKLEWEKAEKNLRGR